MAQIMEFFLNLLLLKGKILTRTAANTLHEVIRKWLKIKRKISTEYNKATNMVGPFDNMLDVINYNAREYTCEGKNLIVTRDIRSCLNERLNEIRAKRKHEVIEEQMKRSKPDLKRGLKPLKTNEKTVSVSHWESRPNILSQWSQNQEKASEEELVKQSSAKINDYIIDNLHAILKSQEFLFKNILKLIHLLEKDKAPVDGEKLDKIKRKLSACTEILSNTYTPRNFCENVIGELIEEEITRCRFRHGAIKTSAEIALKAPQPKGLEVVLETKAPKKTNKIAENRQRIRLGEKRHERLQKSLIDLEARNSSAQSLTRMNRKKFQMGSREHETLRRREIDLEARNSAGFVAKRRRSNIQLGNKEYEVLRRSEIDVEARNSAGFLAKRRRSNIQLGNKEYEVLRRSEIDVEARNSAGFISKRRQHKFEFGNKKYAIWNKGHIDLEVRKSAGSLVQRHQQQQQSYNKGKYDVWRRCEIDLEARNSAERLAKSIPLLVKTEPEFLRKRELDLEVKVSAKGILKGSKSEGIVKLKNDLPSTKSVVTKSEYKTKSVKTGPKQKPPKIDPVSLGDCKKMLEVNQEHFHRFEENLWHSLTTTKYLSLKAEYMDMCKCAFHNKRQFLNFESHIQRQQLQELQCQNVEKILTVNDAMFQIMERKLLIEQSKEERSRLFAVNEREFRKTDEKIQKQIERNRLIEDDTKLLDINQDRFLKFEHYVLEKEELAKKKAKAAEEVDSRKVLAVNEKEFEKTDQKIQKQIARNRLIEDDAKLLDINQNRFRKFEHYVLEKEELAKKKAKAAEEVDRKKILAVNEKQFRKVDSEIGFHMNKKDPIKKVEEPAKEQLLSANETQFQKVAAELDLQEIKTDDINNVPKQEEDGKDLLLVNEAQLQKAEIEQREPDVKIMEKGDNQTNPSENLLTRSEKTRRTTTIQNAKVRQISEERTRRLISVAQRPTDTKMMQTDFRPPVKKNFNLQTDDIVKTKSEQISLDKNLPIANTDESAAEKVPMKKDLVCVNQKPQFIAGKKVALTEKYVSDLENEAEVIKINRKVFDEFENRLMTVRFFCDKSPLINTGLKNPRKNPRIDGTTKKNMSTKQISTIIKDEEICCVFEELDDDEEVPNTEPVNTEPLIISDIGKTFIKKRQENELKKNLVPRTRKLQMTEPISEDLDDIATTPQKSKTFLKSASELTYKKPPRLSTDLPIHKIGVKNPKLPVKAAKPNKEETQTDSSKSKTSISKTKSPLQMRTTKAAMKKRQVLTIMPKIYGDNSKNEKKKPKVALIETEEIKQVKSTQNKQTNKPLVKTIKSQSSVNTKIIKKNVATRKNFSTNRLTKKAPSDKINLVEWEEEDANKFLNKLND